MVPCLATCRQAMVPRLATCRLAMVPRLATCRQAMVPRLATCRQARPGHYESCHVPSFRCSFLTAMLAHCRCQHWHPSRPCRRCCSTIMP